MVAEKMAAEGAPMDEKAKRMRDLLSSFYSPDPSVSSNPSSKSATLDTIDTNAFDPNKYMNLLVQNSNLEGILQRHVQMAAEIKNLDTDLQMLVYENYNKFISATDTIKRMKNNIMGMEANTEQLLEKIMSVQSRSDGVNASLFEKREHVEKLHRTRNLLRKVQFIYDLPTRLGKCIKSEAYDDAVRYYTGAMPILKAYGDSSFQDCKRASEEAVATITKKLQEKVFYDSESIQARAEVVMLLKQLDFPVDSLKVKLLEKLQEFLANLGLVSGEMSNASTDGSDSVSSVVHDASIHEFAEAVRAYRVIFPDSEMQLIKLVHDLVTKHFETVHQYIERQVSSTELLAILRVIWRHVLLMEEVLPEAALHDCTLEAARVSLKEHVASKFTRLLHDISDVITKVQTRREGSEEEYLQVALDATKTAVLQGSMDILLDLRLVLEDNIGVLDKLRDFIIDWVQEGFQDFFRALYDRFLVISGRNNSTSADGTQSHKVLPGLVLILAQVSVFIEQSAILKITEEIAASFSDGGNRGYENGPAFIPGEICRIYRSAAEKFLYLYINMRTQRISVLLRKRFTTPNWIKHKEPREVHMFVDLLIQELEAIGNEVKQVLPHGIIRKHRRSDSNGSTTSSRSNSLRDDRLSKLNTHKAKSQLLETHLAKLFKQKVEIFTKVEFTQESVLTFIVKLCLKSFLEFVRLQTFNRSGFQQIQLDIQFLRTPLKDTVEDEAAIDFLLDEVIVASAERCLDASPLEGPILDKLIHSKMEKTRSPYTS